MLVRTMMEHDTQKKDFSAPINWKSVRERLLSAMDQAKVSVTALSAATGRSNDETMSLLQGNDPIPENWVDTACQTLKVEKSRVLYGNRPSPRDGSTDVIGSSPQNDSHNESQLRSGAGMRLMKLHKERGLTQLQLAEMLGISKGMVSLVETGRSLVSEKIATVAGEKFGVSTNFVLYGEE